MELHLPRFAPVTLRCYVVLMILSALDEKDRKFVRIQWAMKPGEKKRKERTNILRDTPEPEKTRRITLAIAELQVKLLKGGGMAEEKRLEADPVEGWKWVLPYLEIKHRAVQSTLETYQRLWRNLVVFLVESKIESPGMLKRQDAFDYIDWRTRQVKQKSRKSPKQNTALGELKLLGALMDEAVRRAYCASNPVRKLGVEAEEAEIKLEITVEEQRIIERELASRPAWMRRSFTLAIRTGLRFSETRIFRQQVDFRSGGRILIEKPKGGRKKAFSIPIYHSIRPIVQEWWDGKEPCTWTVAQNERKITGLLWHRFFVEVGLPHLCFHSTRVTYITRGMRAGVPEAVMMKMVNHGSKLVSRIYQRWTTDDVQKYADLIPDPTSELSKEGNPHKRASRRSTAEGGRRASRRGPQCN